MKHVNFITTLSPHKQYAMRRWFLITFFVGAVTIAVSLFFMTPPLLTYISLQREVHILRQQTQEYTEHSKQRDTLKTVYEQSRLQSSKVDQYVTSPKNPHAYIAVVMQACGDSVVLESLNIHKKSCEITILCPTAEYATVFIKRLSASELLRGVKLVSVQHDTQTKQMRCVIKGMMV